MIHIMALLTFFVTRILLKPFKPILILLLIMLTMCVYMLEISLSEILDNVIDYIEFLRDYTES